MILLVPMGSYEIFLGGDEHEDLIDLLVLALARFVARSRRFDLLGNRYSGTDPRITGRKLFRLMILPLR